VPSTGTFFSRPDLQKIAGLHLLDGNVLLVPSRSTRAVFAPRSTSFSIASAGLAAAARLEYSGAEQDERRDDRAWSRNKDDGYRAT